MKLRTCMGYFLNRGCTRKKFAVAIKDKGICPHIFSVPIKDKGVCLHIGYSQNKNSANYFRLNHLVPCCDWWLTGVPVPMGIFTHFLLFSPKSSDSEYLKYSYLKVSNL